MRVNFSDCEFGCFEPHRDILYRNKNYRAIDVEVTLEDGSVETHTIAEHNLELELIRDFGEDIDNSELDLSISYYADTNDGVYCILETITGEGIQQGLSYLHSCR